MTEKRRARRKRVEARAVCSLRVCRIIDAVWPGIGEASAPNEGLVFARAAHKQGGEDGPDPPPERRGQSAGPCTSPKLPAIPARGWMRA